MIKTRNKSKHESPRTRDLKHYGKIEGLSRMNIQSMYSDIDLDTNKIETEFQASFEDLLYFINLHLSNTGKGDFDGEEIEIIFNRDMLMSEGDIINNIRNSVGILSEESLVAQHPWVKDLQAELDRKQAEKEIQMDEYRDSFHSPYSNKEEGEVNEQ